MGISETLDQIKQVPEQQVEGGNNAVTPGLFPPTSSHLPQVTFAGKNIFTENPR